MGPESNEDCRTASLTSDPADVAPAIDALMGPLGNQDPLGRLPAAAADDLRLALTEVLNNCILHGYEDQRGRPIEMALRVTPSGVALNVADQGRTPPESLLVDQADAFDPLALFDDKGSEAMAESGRGWAMIRMLTDGLSLEQRDGWNILTMEKTVGA
ncbi:MAG: ATP-binding protein [Pseudomonadota bacterium]